MTMKAADKNMTYSYAHLHHVSAGRPSLPARKTNSSGLTLRRTVLPALLTAVVVALLGFHYKVAVTRVFIMAFAYALLGGVCCITLFWRIEGGQRRWVNPAFVVSCVFALYYGVGNVPCSLWDYGNMYIRNFGSYSYYPHAVILATISLLFFLLGYRKGVRHRKRGLRSITWDLVRVRALVWAYIVCLIIVTLANERIVLPGGLDSIISEFLPTGYILLVLLGFTARGLGKTKQVGPSSLLFATSIVLPTVFFILSNRRFFAISIVILIAFMFRTLKRDWKVRQYLYVFLAAASCYLLVTAGLRYQLYEHGYYLKTMDRASGLTERLPLLSGALDQLASLDTETREFTKQHFARDASYRMAGLEVLAGMIAADVRGNAEYLWGKSILVGLLKMIPRIIWPDKPRFVTTTGSEWSSESLVLSAFDLTQKDQIMTPLSSLYGDGGLLFVIIGMWFAGFFSGRIFDLLMGTGFEARHLVVAIPYSFRLFIFFQRDAVEWLLHPLRNLLIIWLLIKVIDRLCGKTYRRSPVATITKSSQLPKKMHVH
jgi:hypothetical protein